MKKVSEPVTKSLEKTSQDITKTISETSNKSNQAISDLSEKVLELMINKGMIALYLALSLVDLLKPENKSQFKIIKDQISLRLKVFLVNTSIPFTLYSNILTFTDSKKSFKLDGDLLETITNYGFSFGNSNQQDRNYFVSLEKK